METHKARRDDVFPDCCSRVQKLLPGISDDVTLHEITTKLPWAALQILASVNHRWRQAIHSREVYNARVLCHSTEILILLDSVRPEVRTLALYFMMERTSHHLPRIPYLVDGTSLFQRCVTLDGKLYLLGGDSILEANLYNKFCTVVNGSDVFVLDLAGSMEWKQCARMLEARALFDCDVVNGKNYVMGGIYHGKLVGGSEVYDPKRNVWSSLPPMERKRQGHQVLAVGNELFVYGGNGQGGNLEVYCTVQNEWRMTERFGSKQFWETLFTAHGKLHSISTRGIYVRDTESDSWRLRHTNRFPTLGSVDIITVLVSKVVIENDQLLLGALWLNGSIASQALLRCRGFGSEVKEIVWEVLVSSLDFGESMCSIRL